MTDKQIADVLADMIVICDTREKKNQHIIEYFDENDIKWTSQKLDVCDYSVTFGKPENAKYIECVYVERKNSWDEIIGNFIQHRDRFAREFERLNPYSFASIVIEDATWLKLFRGSYRSRTKPKSVIASMITWCYRYNIQTWMCRKLDSPKIIHNLLYYGVMETLKQNREIVK